MQVALGSASSKNKQGTAQSPRESVKEEVVKGEVEEELKVRHMSHTNATEQMRHTTRAIAQIENQPLRLTH